jgi:nucleoside-diphosphate-sugar epimerase
LFDALPERPFEQVRAADLARSRAALDWEPAMALEEGLAATVAWFRAEWQAGRL